MLTLVIVESTRRTSLSLGGMFDEAVHDLGVAVRRPVDADLDRQRIVADIDYVLVSGSVSESLEILGTHDLGYSHIVVDVREDVVSFEVRVDDLVVLRLVSLVFIEMDDVGKSLSPFGDLQVLVPYEL